MPYTGGGATAREGPTARSTANGRRISAHRENTHQGLRTEEGGGHVNRTRVPVWKTSGKEKGEPHSWVKEKKGSLTGCRGVVCAWAKAATSRSPEIGEKRKDPPPTKREEKSISFTGRTT